MSPLASLPPFGSACVHRRSAGVGRSLPTVALLLAAILLPGCKPQAAIGHYQVPHESSAGPFDFTRPEGWLNGIPGKMQIMVFAVRDGDKRAEITISALDEAGSALLPNVNRWRGQMKLAPLSETELDANLKTAPVGNQQGHFVEMLGVDEKQGQATQGVIALHGGLGWFFKLSGDAGLVERERERFLQFVASIKFRSAEGDAHGHR